MNEQEYMNKIKQQAENVPIPDSISPENMKKMLDEKLASSTASKEQTKLVKSRKWVKYIAAACVVLILAGGTGFSILSINMMKESEDATAISGETADVAEEACMDESEDTGSSDMLAYETSLNTPNSYDEYYDTIKETLDNYYDNFAQAETAGVPDNIKAKEFSIQAEEDLLTNAGSSMDSIAVARDYSTTNTQEETIDEGDIIKTDGNYIYKITTNDNNGQSSNILSIIKAENGNLTSESSIDLDHCFDTEENAYVYFQEFYLHQNYLVLLFTNEFDKTETTIVIYDIKDKANPEKKKILTQSGSYQSSRISDGYLYTISIFSGADFSTQQPYANYIPSVGGKLIDCSQIYYSDNVLAQSTYVVTGVNLQSLEISDSIALPAGGGDIYVSHQSIYLYGSVYNEPGKTEFLRIGYEKGKLTPGKSATITGYVYDNYAISEYNDYLRIIATIPANDFSLLRNDMEMIPKDISDDVSEENTTDEKTEELTEDINVLYIFDENMSLVSKLSGIAPGEQVKSVRYIGDMGYLVTYETVDPLFAIDLSDPYNPEITGRLTIPGFSNYLHPYADGLLLGIGEEYTPKDQTFVGLKLSMFDISDPANIEVVDQLILENGYYSTAQYNHKALMIDPEKNIFGFFYQEQIADENYTYITNNYFVTYEYNQKNGFVETGRYKVDMESYEVDTIRGLYIDDYLYISTNHSITSYELNGTKQIDTIQQ